MQSVTQHTIVPVLPLTSSFASTVGDQEHPMTSPRSDEPNQVRVGETLFVPKLVSGQWCLAPSDMLDNLEFTFVVKKDPRTGRTFYVNATTRNRSWQLVDITSLPPLPPLPELQVRGSTVYKLMRSADGEYVYAPQLTNQVRITLKPVHCWVPKADRVMQRYFFLNAQTTEKVMLLPPLCEYVERIQAMVDFYRISTPIAELLDDWSGRESQLLADLVISHGPEPTRPSLVLEQLDAHLRDLDATGVSHPSREALLEAHGGPTEALLQYMRDTYGVAPKTTRQRILLMYQQYAPNKLHQVEDVLWQFHGRYEQLLETLIFKWGPEGGKQTTPPLSGAGGPADYKRRVTALLRVHDPSRLTSVDELLRVNAGREVELIEALSRRHPHDESPSLSTVEYDATSPTSRTGPGSLLHAGSPQLVASSACSDRSVMSPILTPRSASIPSALSASGDYRSRLVAFYKRHNPGKLRSVDETLRKYAGQEEFLMDQLVRKYGPEPAPQLLDASPLSVPAEEVATVDTRPVRDRVMRMLERYAPDSIPFYSSTLRQFDGDEHAMLSSLVAAYGAEPTSDDRSSSSHVTTSAQVANRSSSSQVAAVNSNATAADSDTRSDETRSVSEVVTLVHTSEATAAVTETPRTRRRSQSLVDVTRTKISKIFSEHAPEMITSVDQLLAQYQGREEELVRELSEQYGLTATTMGTAVVGPADHTDQNTEIASPPAADDRPVPSEEEIRRQISEKHRANNEAFLRSLDEKMALQIFEQQQQAQSIQQQRHHADPVAETATTTEVPAAISAPAEADTLPAVGGERRPSSAAVDHHPPSVLSAPSELLDTTSAVGQLSALERRMREAFDSTERTLKRNEQLHDENIRLSSSLHDLERQCSAELMEMQRRLSAAEEEKRKLEHQFALERIQLQTKEESVELRMKKETQEERNRYLEAHLKTVEERRKLEQLLMEQKGALSSAELQVRSLTTRVENREKELKEAREEVRFLKIQVGEGDKCDAVAQTDVTMEHMNRALMEEQVSEGVIERWKHKVEALQREIEVSRAERREMVDACENAAKFVQVLQTKKRNLEDTIARLELRELALPSTSRSAADVEYNRLQDEVISLQSQLDASHIELKKSKQETLELRLLLSRHMAGAVPRMPSSSISVGSPQQQQQRLATHCPPTPRLQK